MEHPLINPDTGEPEGRFRARVREILDLPWDTRNEAIFAKLRALMRPTEFRLTSGGGGKTCSNDGLTT